MNRKKEKAFDIEIWKKLVPFASPYKKHFLIMFLLNIILAAIDVLVPLFQSFAINHFITKNTLSGIEGFSILYVSMIVLQTICVFTSVHSAITIEMNLGKDLKSAQFEHLQKLSFSYYNVTPVGYIHARVMSDTSRIATLVAWSLVDMLWALVYVVAVFVIMIILNYKLAFIIMLIVPAIALLTVYFQNKILKWNRKIRTINAQITSGYNEGITGVKTAKSMVIEQENEKEFRSITEQMRSSSCRAAKLNAIFVPVILMFSSVAAAAVLMQGGYMVKNQIIELGVLSVFISYAVIIFEPIQQIARLLADLISGQANIERVMALLEEEPNITEKEHVFQKYGDVFAPKTENWESMKGHITFENVSFKYPDGSDYVLENFNLEVAAGTNVAIVGETGAGKSTLVNLLGRFFEPTKGRILIDGIDYKERSQLWLHRQMGYVLQNPHLFSGTIKENILYGRLNATDDEVIEAAKKAKVHDVIMQMPNGYDSEVGESGERLSTGEKQLISFARAILAEPVIFILDEATSSIDTQTEQLIQSATEELLKGHTSFVIAHRLSTIRKADLILVVKDGKIIEQGNHKKLLAQKGYYFDLYEKQYEEESIIKLLNDY